MSDQTTTAPSAPNVLTTATTTTTPPTTTTVTFTDAFKTAVISYCEKDDERMKLQKKIKGIKDDLKDLEENIVQFMENNNLPVFDTGEKGLFKSGTKKKTGGINKKLIIEALGKCGQLKDIAKAEEVAEYIYNSRSKENVKFLSRKN